MAIKKSQLYASLWESCDELRGGMDASQYKDYILVLLFMKYVSDKAASQPHYLLQVPPGARFADMVAAKGKPDIGDRINKIIHKLADANEQLKGAIDQADFNDPSKLGQGKEMVDRLSNLIEIFENPALDFRGNRAEGDDLLGDAYEYLMRHFATESGKSKGQFYTPAEVSRIMAKVVGMGTASRASQTIYDPTCGSGSLLIKAHDEAKQATGLNLTIYGQEMDNATRALAQMNMVLHDATTAEIWRDNTLAAPHWKNPGGGLKTFDFIVANPPFSAKSWRNGFDPEHDEYGRFPYGLPPAKNGDYAFLLHILASLKSTGKAAVILPHGVLFRGNAEAPIRREIVRRGYVKGIIGLPPNLFYGTGIPACIVVIDKEGADARDGIFMIDASRGFAKDGAKNRLREQDLHRIVDTFTRCVEEVGYSRLVPMIEIERNGFNLNIARYIESSESKDTHSIEAHLRGGIPEADVAALGRYWDVFPSLRAELFEPDREGYARLTVASDRIDEVIFEHPEVAELVDDVRARLGNWRTAAAKALRSVDTNSHPKSIVADLSEELLDTFRGVRLIDPYDVYQQFMDYSSRTLLDDLYLVVDGGWSRAAKPRVIIDKKNQKAKDKEEPDFVVGKQKFKSDLLDAELMISRYFAGERAAIEQAGVAAAAAAQVVAGAAEEHGGEDGLLESVVSDSGNITKGAIAARLRELGDDEDTPRERDLLKVCLEALAEEANAKATGKRLTAELALKLQRGYAALTEDEARELTVGGKWLPSVEMRVLGEVERVTRSLSSRVAELAARYARSLPSIELEIDETRLAVTRHLASMGYEWS